MIVKTATINSEKCPLCYSPFAILDIESKKKPISYRGRAHIRRAFRFLGVALENPRRCGAMTKKKAKSGKPTAKKAAKKRQARKKELNPAEVRKDISMLVQAQAKEMAAAVIGSGKQGQLAPVKYLFEMANIFPAPTDGSESTKDEDSLAETLLQRLNIPTTPIVQGDEGEEIVIPARVEAKMRLRRTSLRRRSWKLRMRKVGTSRF